MRIDLPDVTVVAIDTITHDKTLFAIEKTLDQINPGNLLIFSDLPEKFRNHADCVIKVLGVTSLNDVGAVIWYQVPQMCRTSHVLFIQYDGFVLNGSAWKPEFLDYDYIGAPWLWHATHQVGNGGFSLRSRRLLDFLARHEEEFPLSFPEDDAICRKYGDQLEAKGFIFAPVRVAEQFSYERSPPRPSFGFHGIFNLAHALGDKFEAWAETACPYIRSKSEWRELAMLRSL